MDDNNFRRYYVDWWSIRRSSIYVIVGILASLIFFGGGIWWLWQNNWMITPPDEQEAPKDSAQIISFEGNVKIIRVSNRATERVTKTTYVQAGDTIQTQADGRAQVRMIDGSVLSVRPNSTVVISDSSSILGGTSVKVKLDDGQINVKTEDQPEASNNVVEVKETENKLQSQTDASFNINKETNTGEIRISRGGIESQVGDEKVVIKEDQYVSIDEKKIAAQEKLLAPPSLTEPSPSKQILTTRANSIRFIWDQPEGHPNATYEFQLAHSPFFVSGKMIAEEKSLDNARFIVRKLQAGTYFWRVRSSIKSGQSSEWSNPSKFSVVKQSGSDRIELTETEVENVGGTIYIVRGTTKPGATVSIMGRETFAKANGTFRVQVSARGSSVRVLISDELGNRSQYTVSLRTGRVR